jgi:hypothetical protein
MVDQVLPRVQHRQWVLSMPKRVRWHLRHKPEVISGLLAIFLRAVETTIRQCSPGAPPGARFGAVAFVHRFGSYLNSTSTTMPSTSLTAANTPAAGRSTPRWRSRTGTGRASSTWCAIARGRR